VNKGHNYTKAAKYSKRSLRELIYGEYIMAQLSSPGVSVTVIDESFYTPAAPGTVPLIIVASEESKQNSASTGTAAGTLKANAGKVYLLTSQKDLSDTFGTSKFITDASNNPVHAGEQNEYGLQAAYSYLGVSNRAYVVRADIDLAQLNAKTTSPSGTPEDGTFWFDTATTKFGIFEWNAAAASVTNGQSFMVKYPLVITDITKVANYPGAPAPKASIGAVGSYAIVAVSTLIKLWYKKPATHTSAGWVEVGSDEWQVSWPTIQGTESNPVLSISSDTLVINGITTTGTTLQNLIDDINSKLTIEGITAAAPAGKLELYSTGVAISITAGTAVTPTNKIGVSIGTYNATALTIAPHTQVPQYKVGGDKRPTGSVWIKTTYPNLGADWVVKRYNTNTSAWSTMSAPLYANNAAALVGLDSTGGGINLAANTVYVKFNDSEDISALANFKLYRRRGVGSTSITSSVVTSSTFLAETMYSFTISETTVGNTVLTSPVTIDFTVGAAPVLAVAVTEIILAAIQTALVGSNIIATINNNTNQITISHIDGGDFTLVDVTGSPISKMFNIATTSNLYAAPTGEADVYVASMWTSVTDNKSGGFAIASADAPTTIAPDNQLWYNSIIDEVDIMMHNGTQWVGYLEATAKTINLAGETSTDLTNTDPAGPIISATKPLLQSDGSALANGDIWISTADLENFPLIYKYDKLSMKWLAVDSADQTTENGIVFHDARWNTTGKTADASSIDELLLSNFVDFDAPDPALYPKGMLLWNLRRSGYNVKRFSRDYINILNRNLRVDETMADYYPHRWVSEAGNQEDGSGTFGRKAQRKVVVQALQALVNSNQQIRDEESRIFNLIACPGYPELIGELVGLNVDRGLTAFVVGDTPARLTPDSTTLSNWGNNANLAVEDNDTGLVSFDEYLGVFYPWGYTSDNIGNNVVVPPSHMILRTIALSDNVSYPWFAPAGTRRGGITNASAVGHVDAQGEFQSIALTNGHRDTLASIKVNPITYITGSGLVNYGQLTRGRNASALDRINVARLVIYLRRQLAQLAKPYIFEPNDKITRDEIKQAAESLLLELVGQRALYDYVVVCDTSNNTPARIDRNELYLDIAIEPVKAVEFIYIPLRLKNTGEIKGLG
jgi:hypothetical protein